MRIRRLKEVGRRFFVFMEVSGDEAHAGYLEDVTHRMSLRFPEIDRVYLLTGVKIFLEA